MSKNNYEAIVVGGGLAGIHAAQLLAETGLNIAIVDENQMLGGQYLRRRSPDILKDSLTDFAKRTGKKMLRTISKHKIKILSGAEVLSLEQDRQMLIRDSSGNLFETHPKSVILATGARERFTPFRGWTLPGVISTGALQIMVKTTGNVPKGRIVVAGSSVFPYGVFAQMLKHGNRPKALIDQNSFFDKIRFLGALAIAPEKLPEAVETTLRIAVGGTIPKFGNHIIEARGTSKLQSVIAAKLNATGNPIPGTEKEYSCEWLALGQGFVANTELASLAGCRMIYDTKKSGWIVDVADDFQSSQGGIFAAGEITGIAGAGKSIIEGTLAGYGVLQFLGKKLDSSSKSRIRRLNSTSRRHVAFGALFNSLYAPDEKAFTSIPDETIVCRCEDISMGEVRGAIANGCLTADEVKRTVRAGMGICQGRGCGPFLSDLISVTQHIAPADLPPLKVRFPVKAATLEDLSGPVSSLP